MIAIPTTAGTGSETSGTAIFDYQEMHVKTGIAHQYLRPVMGIIDPENTRTLPQQRLTKLSPRPFNEADLAGIFMDSMSYW